MHTVRISIFAAVGITLGGLAAQPVAAQSSEKWQMLSTLTRTHDHGKEYILRFDNIKKRTNGRLEIAFVPYGETPHKSPDALRIVRDGLAEMSMWYPAYSSATYPLLGAPGLPFLDPNRPDTASAQGGADRVWASKAMAAELARIHGLFNVVESSSGYVEPMNFYMQKVINGPEMHRWHHARDEEICGKNFATVFSVFDRAFGTFYCPGPCNVPLGIEAPMAPGALGQYVYPLQAWFGPRPVETRQKVA